jgi:hypothetical protein
VVKRIFVGGGWRDLEPGEDFFGIDRATLDEQLAASERRRMSGGEARFYGTAPEWGAVAECGCRAKLLNRGKDARVTDWCETLTSLHDRCFRALRNRDLDHEALERAFHLHVGSAEDSTIERIKRRGSPQLPLPTDRSS